MEQSPENVQLTAVIAALSFQLTRQNSRKVIDHNCRNCTFNKLVYSKTLSCWTGYAPKKPTGLSNFGENPSQKRLIRSKQLHIVPPKYASFIQPTNHYCWNIPDSVSAVRTNHAKYWGNNSASVRPATLVDITSKSNLTLIESWKMNCCAEFTLSWNKLNTMKQQNISTCVPDCLDVLLHLTSEISKAVPSTREFPARNTDCPEHQDAAIECAEKSSL